MRYLYTTTPDENCHEVTKGIYGRPVHTSQQKALLDKGWKFRISDVEQDHGLRKNEEERRQEERQVRAPGPGMSEYDFFRVKYEEAFGKPPHHKMKSETIRQKLEQADD